MKLTHYKQQALKCWLILLTGYCLSACADIYQWQDTHGKRHFSDRAKTNSKKLDIKPSTAFYTVEKVFDGDTVKLTDGKRIRLLGINTPEVHHRGQRTEAGGEAAKTWLANKLTGQKVQLITDAEPTDKYQRTLAHLITDRKDHINLQLVEMGLASVNIYPPNLMYAEQLMAAENRAEQARRGIWANPQYAPLLLEQLGDDGHDGWTRLVGKIKALRKSRKFIYLEFSDKFQARIEKRWLKLFPEPDSYLNHTVEVRGWLNKNRGDWSMLLRHPSAIKTRPD
jgi:micrococcal nuclease